MEVIANVISKELKFSDFHSEKREDLNRTGIYQITHEKKPGFYYIGSAAKSNKVMYRDIGFLQRWRHHICDFRKGNHHNRFLRAVVNKYGLGGLKFKIIEHCEPTKCYERETYYIQKFKKEFNVYNHSEFAHGTLGVKHSPESVEKRVAKKRKKVYQYDMNGIFLKEWPSLTSVKESSLGSANVSRCLSDGYGSSGGFQWSYKKVDNHPYSNCRPRIEDPVYQFDYNGNLLNRFDNPTDAAEKSGVPVENIRRSCNKTAIRGWNYIWSYGPTEDRRWPCTVKRKSVIQYDMRMNFIKEYPSLTLAAKGIGSDTTAIANCCKQKPHCISAKGFIFRYKELTT